MKTTPEIPDAVFRRAKSLAARRGIALREFVTEAVKEKPGDDDKATESRGWRLSATCGVCGKSRPKSTARSKKNSGTSSRGQAVILDMNGLYASSLPSPCSWRSALAGGRGVLFAGACAGSSVRLGDGGLRQQVVQRSSHRHLRLKDAPEVARGGDCNFVHRQRFLQSRSIDATGFPVSPQGTIRSK